jgi:uncharacterized protein Yka (UPF0111/DUF47 family)
MNKEQIEKIRACVVGILDQVELLLSGQGSLTEQGEERLEEIKSYASQIDDLTECVE